MRKPLYTHSTAYALRQRILTKGLTINYTVRTTTTKGRRIALEGSQNYANS